MGVSEKVQNYADVILEWSLSKQENLIKLCISSTYHKILVATQDRPGGTHFDDWDSYLPFGGFLNPIPTRWGEGANYSHLISYMDVPIHF